MKYLLLLILCTSFSVLAEEDKPHHSFLFSYGAMIIVGQEGYSTYQYEYIFDSNTGVSLNYIDIEHTNGTSGSPIDEYQVDVVTLKVTQYFQLSKNWSVYVGASYGQANPTFYEAEQSQLTEFYQDKFEELYFDKENGYSYSFGVRHHIAANIFWGLGFERYRMGKYEPYAPPINLSISYRF